MRRRAVCVAMTVEDAAVRAEFLRNLRKTESAAPLAPLASLDAIVPDDDEAPHKEPHALEPREARRQLGEELARVRAAKVARSRAA